MLDSPNSAIAADLPHSFLTNPAAFDERRENVADAMARVMRVNARQGQSTSAYDFAAAGIGTADVHANFARAKRIIDAEVIRQDAVPEEEPELRPWDADADYRTIRIDRAARAIAGLFDPLAIHALLRADNFTSEEIGALWPQILAEAGRKLAAVQP